MNMRITIHIVCTIISLWLNDQIICLNMKYDIQYMCSCRELLSYRLIDYCKYVFTNLHQLVTLQNELNLI